jgi:GH15 family glucan-1,4-alpha-glucosidase
VSREHASSYQPIEDYGIIGNLHTAALVGKNGSIDWLCYPRFDSPSVFAAILDSDKGGYFRIYPTNTQVSRKQIYWPDTNVLITRFLSADGVGEIVDFMPIGGQQRTTTSGGSLIRRVRVLRGCLRFRVECYPAFNYARDDHRVEIVSGGVKFHSKQLHLAVASSIKLKREDSGAAAEFEFELNEGQNQTFELYGIPENAADHKIGIDGAESEESFRSTIRFWRDWLSRSTYRGGWREMVNRSALVLKLLSYEPTGAIVAAPTCSLPESIGGSCNWDYRFSWIRDSAFVVYSLMRLGFTDEASRFVSFLDARCRDMGKDGSLQTVYGINGEHRLKEETLDHLEGYMGSRPVRIGNAAYRQLQLDIYGELMDSVYLYNK